MLGLGVWQLYRLNIKNEAIQLIENRISSPAKSFSSFSPHDSDDHHTKYMIQGDFLPGKDMFLYGSHPKHKEKHGYFVLTPLKLVDGGVVLVNRGWISPTSVNEIIQKQTMSQRSLNNVEIVAVKMIPKDYGGDRTSAKHRNDKKRNIWFYMDMNEMAGFVNESIESRFYFTLLSGEPMDDSITGVDKEYFLNIYNNHLLYSIMWFALAISLGVVCYMYYRNQDRS
jgi:surfeit locus 1 family protein